MKSLYIIAWGVFATRKLRNISHYTGHTPEITYCPGSPIHEYPDKILKLFESSIGSDGNAILKV